jgi:hypothetical protein
LHRKPAPTIKKEQRPNKISHPFQKGNGRNSVIEKKNSQWGFTPLQKPLVRKKKQK